MLNPWGLREMVKVLLNCTTLVKGGSLQVATSIFQNCIKDKDIEWYFALTEKLYSMLENLLKPWFFQGRILIFKKSPSRSLNIRIELKQKIDALSFDAIFTLFGPAYVKFSVPHLCGIADGWVTHANEEAYQLLPTFKEKILTYLLCCYKLWWFQAADQWCVEATAAKDGFLKKTNLPLESVMVVPNAVNQLVQAYSDQIIERKLGDVIKIFCLGADYWHKNYLVIPYLLSILKLKSNKKFNFILTLPENSPIFLRLMKLAVEKNVAGYIINLGPLALDEVIIQYNKCDILFFPSVLETFSITPLEALYMNMPMVISDFSFNKDIIKDYANYVNPLDIDEISEKFLQLLAGYSQELNKLQELKRSAYFKKISTSRNRFETYKKILQEMINKCNG